MAAKKTIRRGMVTLVVLIVLAVIAFAVYRGHADKLRASGHAAYGMRPGGKHATIPVDVTPVTKRNLQVYLNGLGTVQAYNIVTVRPQVSGQLLRVLFHEGDEVKKGQLLAEIDPRTYEAALEQAKAKLAQDEAQIKTAQADLARFKKLAPQGYVSGQQLGQQKNLVAQDKAAIAADRAAIQSDAVQLSYTKITSPISGRLGMRLVDAGNIVTAGETNGIVVVTQMKPISVVFTLPEKALEQLLAVNAQQAQTRLPVQALDRSNNKVLAIGKLTAVNNQINTSTGTIELKATFTNKSEKLWPGQFVNARLMLKTLEQASVAPVVAVQQGPAGAYVYVLEGDGTVKMQAVTTGVTQGGFVQITKGLSVGDTVVVDGQYRLKPGARVKARKIAPAAAASSAMATLPAAAP